MFNFTSSSPFIGELNQSDDFNHMTSIAQSHLEFVPEELSGFS